MDSRKRIFFLVGIMFVVVLIVQLVTVSTLYRAAIQQERQRLTETAKSQARLIEAIARSEKRHSSESPSATMMATLSQVRDSHSKYRGIGETGEFTLSKKENDQIVFLLSHRHYDLDEPKPVPWDSELAAPMRMALSGRSGTIIGLDYRGEIVLAAHEPVSELDLGIVAKIDLTEVRAPFIKASLFSGACAIFFILLGAVLFLRVTNPLIERLQHTVRKLQSAISEVKTLRGLLPICSFCKNIRDDKGYWNRIESYISDHAEVEFSHGLCPDCAKKHYSEFYKPLEKKL